VVVVHHLLPILTWARRGIMRQEWAILHSRTILMALHKLVAQDPSFHPTQEGTTCHLQTRGMEHQAKIRMARLQVDTRRMGHNQLLILMAPLLIRMAVLHVPETFLPPTSTITTKDRHLRDTDSLLLEVLMANQLLMGNRVDNPLRMGNLLLPTVLMEVLLLPMVLLPLTELLLLMALVRFHKGIVPISTAAVRHP